MNISDIKEAVVDFVANYYDENGVAPSLKKICDGVPGLSKRKFYEEFEGITETCKLAGIPEPRDRMKATSKAREGKQRPKTSKTEDLDEVDEVFSRVDRLAAELGVTGRLKALDEAITVAAEVVPRVDKLTRLSGVKERGKAIDKQIDLTSKLNVHTFRFNVKTPVDVITKLEKINQKWQKSCAEHKKVADEVPSLRKKVEEYENLDQYDLAEWLGVSQASIRIYKRLKLRNGWPEDSLGAFINGAIKSMYEEIEYILGKKQKTAHYKYF